MVDLCTYYLARGADHDASSKFEAFRKSYERYRAGVDHRLCIIFKGFENSSNLQKAEDIFRDVAHCAIYVTDDGFDLGAYFVAASRFAFEYVCFLNTASVIAGQDWLKKLALNCVLPGVGIVGCSGSYEAPQHPNVANKPFPNPHIRTTAFMMRRSLFLTTNPGHRMTTKKDVHLLEHGLNGITQEVCAHGLRALVVGKNGRGYEQPSWPLSRTFRQGTQDNLLVHDNQSRQFDQAPIAEKRELYKLAWGNGVPILLGGDLSDSTFYQISRIHTLNTDDAGRE